MGEATRRKVSPVGSPRTRMLQGMVGLILSALVLVGCQSSGETTPVTLPEMGDEGQESPAPQPVEPPEFYPDGSAEQNRPYVDWVLRQAGAGVATLTGADAVAALEAGGLSRATMELTADRTAIGLEADSISLALQIAGECLIAQWSAEWVVTQVAPLLASGTCLLGETVSLN